MGIIEAKDVKYSYTSEENITPALTGVDLEVERGGFVAIIGHNGSGKSTFAKHINALLEPDSGSVIVDGMDTADEKNVWDIRAKAGMVFQNPDNQLVATIVEEDVAFGPENIGVPPEEIRKRVDEALKIVDMTEYAERAPHMLSGGQKQRVAIAGVLAMQPDIIVFDEPTAMLDPEGRDEVMDKVKMLGEQGKTIVFITHYMEEALEAENVAVMTGGQVVKIGAPREVFTDLPALEEAGLMPPPHISLYHRLKNKGIDIGQCPLTVDELADGIAEKLADRKPVETPSIKRSEKKTQGDTAISLKNLTYTYMPGTPFEAKAVDDISIDIGKSEFLGIIGHTGSGKTTLISLLAGLLKPMEGAVEIGGEDIGEKRYDRKKLRRHVGVVFQYPEHQLFEETVYKDIAFGPGKIGVSEAETAHRVRHAMELMELDFEAMKDLSPFELSGGQKRRVAIAGVLAMQPEVLILDEPVAGLDPQGRTHLMNLINHLNDEGATIIMITHSMDDLAENARRVLVLENGRLVMDDTPNQVFARGEELQKIGLDTPYVSKIAAALNERGISVPRDVVRLGDLEACLVREGEAADD